MFSSLSTVSLWGYCDHSITWLIKCSGVVVCVVVRHVAVTVGVDAPAAGVFVPACWGREVADCCGVESPAELGLALL